MSQGIQDFFLQLTFKDRSNVLHKIYDWWVGLILYDFGNMCVRGNHTATNQKPSNESVCEWTNQMTSTIRNVLWLAMDESHSLSGPSQSLWGIRCLFDCTLTQTLDKHCQLFSLTHSLAIYLSLSPSISHSLSVSSPLNPPSLSSSLFSICFTVYLYLYILIFPSLPISLALLSILLPLTSHTYLLTNTNTYTFTCPYRFSQIS